MQIDVCRVVAIADVGAAIGRPYDIIVRLLDKLKFELHEKNRSSRSGFRFFACFVYHNVRVSSSFLTLFASHRCAYGDTLDSRMYNSLLKVRRHGL